MLMARRFISQNGGIAQNGNDQNGGGGGGGALSTTKEVEGRTLAPPEETLPEVAVQAEPIPAFVPQKPKPPIFIQPPAPPEEWPDFETIPEVPLEIAVQEETPITPEVIVVPPEIVIPGALPIQPPTIEERQRPRHLPRPVDKPEPILILADKPPEITEDQKALIALGRNIDGEQSIVDAIRVTGPRAYPTTEAVGFEDPPTKAQITGRSLLWLVLVGIFAGGILKIFPDK